MKGKKLFNSKKYSRGLTLVELIIVLVVLGLIVGIVLTRVGNPLKETTLNSKVIETTNHLRQLGESAQAYYAMNLQEPSDQDALVNARLLDSVIKPPDGVTTDNTTEYEFTQVTTTINNTPTTFVVIRLNNVNLDLCRRFNEKNNVSVNNNAFQPNQIYHCVLAANGNSGTIYRVLWRR